MIFFQSRGGQSSVEYLFMVALALMVIVPGSIMFYQYTTSSQEQILHSQVYKIGNDLTDAATLMYSVGSGSWKSIELTLPSQVKSIKVYNDTISELVITYGGDLSSDGVFFSTVPLFNSSTEDCTAGCILPIKEGYNKIRILSEGGRVIYTVVN